MNFLKGVKDPYSVNKHTPIFTVRDLQYAGVDGSICKAVLIAASPGFIDAKNLYGIGIQIKTADAELTNEVKRIGYIRDRE